MADLLFVLKKVIANLVLPPTILIVLGIVGLMLLQRSPRIARALLWTVMASLLLLSLPIVERSLMASLATPTLVEQQAKLTQAIMILGGGISRATPEYGDTLSQYSLERVRYGAMLARRLHLPILVTGGQVYGGQAEGEVMAEMLRREFGVEVSWVENRSRDTADNAAFTAELLLRDNIHAVLLVTQDFHMKRALRACATTAIQCIGAPVTSYSKVSDNWIEELPNSGTLRQNTLALHELLGLLAQRIH